MNWHNTLFGAYLVNVATLNLKYLRTSFPAQLSNLLRKRNFPCIIWMLLYLYISIYSKSSIGTVVSTPWQHHRHHASPSTNTPASTRPPPTSSPPTSSPPISLSSIPTNPSTSPPIETSSRSLCLCRQMVNPTQTVGPVFAFVPHNKYWLCWVAERLMLPNPLQSMFVECLQCSVRVSPSLPRKWIHSEQVHPRTLVLTMEAISAKTRSTLVPVSVGKTTNLPTSNSATRGVE